MSGADVRLDIEIAMLILHWIRGQSSEQNLPSVEASTEHADGQMT